MAVVKLAHIFPKNSSMKAEDMMKKLRGDLIGLGDYPQYSDSSKRVSFLSGKLFINYYLKEGETVESIQNIVGPEFVVVWISG